MSSRRTLIIVSLLLRAAFSYSQAYLPMFSEPTEWNFVNCTNDSSCTVDRYNSFADTTIGTSRYNLIDGYHFNKTIWAREDTMERKVYMYATHSGPMIEEYLIYDFSMNVCDSLSLYNIQAPIPSQSGYFTLDSTQIMMYEGIARKTYYLSGNDTTKRHLNRAIWIEGLGSMSLINTPGLFPDPMFSGASKCIYKSGILAYQTHKFYGKPCTSSYNPPNTVRESPNHKWRIYNTKQTKHFIITKPLSESGNIWIWNPLGQLLLHRSIPSVESYVLDLNHLQPGTYIINMHSNGDKEPSTMVRMKIILN